MNEFPLQLLKQVDSIDEQIRNLQKSKQGIFQRLSSYKKQIENDNYFLIGKRAMCQNFDSPKEVECVCTSVIALDDYSSIKPLFSRNGKKYIVENYEWIK